MWKLLLVPVVAALLLGGAVAYYYRGGYTPPSIPLPAVERIELPSYQATEEFRENPPQRQAVVLVDISHDNDFLESDLTVLIDRIAARGGSIQYLGTPPHMINPFASTSRRISLLEEKLRLVNSMVIIQPRLGYNKEEVALLKRFVGKGGRLLLLGNASAQEWMNTVANPFGIVFEDDSLYNVVEHATNYQNVPVRSFANDPLTEGLQTIVLYGGSSLRTTGQGLAFTDANTRSSKLGETGPLTPLVKSTQGRVAAIGDFAFLTGERPAVADHMQLTANLAEFLTGGQRRFELADFPFFFTGPVDLVIGEQALLEAAFDLRDILAEAGIEATLQEAEDPSNETVFLGLYQHLGQVEPYLLSQDIRIDEEIHTPFTTPQEREGMSLIYRYQEQGRSVLILLADTEAHLEKTVDQLGFGYFRKELVSRELALHRLAEPQS